MGGGTTNHRIPESQRHETLTSLAGAMRRRGMTEVEISAALQVANRDRCDPPLPVDEVGRIAKSVARNAPGDASLTEGFPLRDLGIAQQLVARHGYDLRYVTQRGKWLVRDGTRWAEDDNCEVVRRAKETVLSMHEAACRLPVGDDENTNKRRLNLIKYTLR